MVCGEYLITAREEICPGVFDYRVQCPPLCADAVPGQFVHIGVPGFPLRRPVSLCGIDAAGGEARLVFEARGEGTRALAALGCGDKMDLLGPLGSGFALLDPAAHAALVGGGIGVPPLLPLAQHYGGSCTAILGFRSRDRIVLDLDCAALCDTVVCTDDGSFGVEGSVVPALEALAQACRLDIIYACGPRPMLKAVAGLAARYGVRCQLSLEERMACGVGACLGCAVRLHSGMARVCKDGPVFEAADVAF